MHKGTLLTQLDKLMNEWRLARQNTRVIEKLREKRWGEYVQGRNFEEQAAADELAQQMHGFEM